MEGEDSELKSECEYHSLKDEGDTVSKPRQHRKSVLCSLIAATCFAFCSYIIGFKSNIGLLAILSLNIGNLIIAISYVLFFAIKSMLRKDTIWDWKQSYFRHPRGGLNTFNIKILIMYTLSSILTSVVLIYWFYFALEANLNQGILTSLFTLTGVFSAVASYMLFDERLKKTHIIGMILMFICVVGISFSSTTASADLHQPALQTNTTAISVISISNDKGISQAVYAALAIIFSLLFAASFWSGGIIVKIAEKGPKKDSQYDTTFNSFSSTHLTIALYFWINVVFIPISIGMYEAGPHKFEIGEYLILALSGFLGAVGILFLNYALVIGLAGPVFAISNFQTIILTVLDIVLLGQVPSVIEVISALFGILGSCVIALHG